MIFVPWQCKTISKKKHLHRGAWIYGKNPYQIIRTNQPGYSKVFRTIADYILENPEQVLQANIHQLGRDLDVAESSIVRFCKAIGYSGFSELKIMLAKYGRQDSKIILKT